MNSAPGPSTKFQADHHWLYNPEGFVLLQDYVLHLQHVKAYEAASPLVRGLVADIGCNMGYGTAQLRATHDGGVIGIDVSERAVKTARDRFGGEFRISDGTRLPCEEGEFDSAVSMQVLEHIPDVPAFLREIRRAVKPGGPVILSTPNAGIRLGPNQAPWNRFHVREYSAKALYDELRPHFAEVVVLGLHGVPELEAIELRRVSRLRRIGAVRGIMARFVSLSLEDRMIEALKRLRRLPKRRLSAEELSQFNTTHLWFEERHLEAALALLAICKC